MSTCGCLSDRPALSQRVGDLAAAIWPVRATQTDKITAYNLITQTQHPPITNTHCTLSTEPLNKQVLIYLFYSIPHRCFSRPGRGPHHNADPFPACIATSVYFPIRVSLYLQYIFPNRKPAFAPFKPVSAGERDFPDRLNDRVFVHSPPRTLSGLSSQPLVFHTRLQMRETSDAAVGRREAGGWGGNVVRS